MPDKPPRQSFMKTFTDDRECPQGHGTFSGSEANWDGGRPICPECEKRLRTP